MNFDPSVNERTFSKFYNIFAILFLQFKRQPWNPGNKWIIRLIHTREQERGKGTKQCVQTETSQTAPQRNELPMVELSSSVPLPDIQSSKSLKLQTTFIAELPSCWSEEQLIPRRGSKEGPETCSVCGQV